MTPLRIIFPAAIGLVMTLNLGSAALAQTQPAAETIEMRARAAAAQWEAGAARRAQLRAQVNRQGELTPPAKDNMAPQNTVLNDEAKAKNRIAAFASKQRMDLQDNRAAAAKKNWLDAQARRAALRAALKDQAQQDAALQRRRRAEREAAAQAERKQAAARRENLRAALRRQAAEEAQAKVKAAAKARAMALINKRLREKALAERRKAEAEVKARLAALEKAKAAAKAKAIAAAKSAAKSAREAKAKASRQLVIATWGGGYGAAQRRALFAPFEKQSGMTTKSVKHSGPADQELSRRADVLNVGSASAERGCKSGRLMPLDDLALEPAPGNNPIAGDLIEGARVKCGVASMAWSHVLLVRTKSFKARVPTSLKHVFDVRRYPGKRAFVKSPRYILELALMADGVKPADVYGTLATYEGLSRALTKLEPLRPYIVWISRASEAYDLLRSGKVAIASAYSGRAFRMVTSNPGIKTIWDGQIYDVDYWAVPRSSLNKPAALQFIKYATAPKSLAANARYFPYGPMRRSAVEMTGRHNVLDIDLAPFLPTSKKNLRSALKFNSSWWASNEDQIRSDPWFEQITRPMPIAPRSKTTVTKPKHKKHAAQ